VAQEVEHLLYKCKALSSNPVPTKKKKEKEVCQIAQYKMADLARQSGLYS
jgi:hypothetical protein